MMVGAFCASPAAAQEAFTFSWQVQDVAGLGPANGDGIIEPGEDAMIYLHASFRPGGGGTAIWDTHGGSGQQGVVAGLGQAIFHLIGDRSLHTGEWVTLSPVPGFALSPIGSVQPGTNNLIGMIFGQYAPPGITPDPRNDDWFFRARWRPSGYTPRGVSFRFQNEIAWGLPAVILDVGLRDPLGQIEYRVDRWSFNEPAGGFTIVPGPGPLAAALVFLPLTRRRR